MIFSRIIYSAILIGIVTGVVLSCLQVINLNPIIVAAESFEVDAGGAGNAADDHSGHSHEHSHDDWAPADGLERTTYTFLANVLASTGFAAILLAMMAQFWLARERNISWSQGLLWGLAGYLAVFVAPAFGLPPEIPGAVAAPVEHRQAVLGSCFEGAGLFPGGVCFLPILPGLLAGHGSFALCLLGLR